MTSTNLGYQQALFEMPATDHIVNVASVPQRSPFRYPGGKTWLVPRIRQWLTSLSSLPSVLIEPFAGGAIVGLTAAFEELANEVLLVELDQQVAAVWKTILGCHANWLADRILSFDVTIENVRAELGVQAASARQMAFQTILRNRTFHGGILAPGSSLIKTGENGRGLRSRWYPETLAHRILAINAIRDRISIVEGDGIAILGEHSKRKGAAFFIDPPYTAPGKQAGARLYKHHILDHQQLFAIARRGIGDFLMTYDNADSVLALAIKHGFQTKCVAMKNTHHARMLELLIGRDLSWLR